MSLVQILWIILAEDFHKTGIFWICLDEAFDIIGSRIDSIFLSDVEQFTIDSDLVNSRQLGFSYCTVLYVCIYSLLSYLHAACQPSKGGSPEINR